MKFKALFVILALSVSSSAFAQKKSDYRINENKVVSEGSSVATSGGTISGGTSAVGIGGSAVSAGGAVDSGPAVLPQSGGGISAQPMDLGGAASTK